MQLKFVLTDDNGNVHEGEIELKRSGNSKPARAGVRAKDVQVRAEQQVVEEFKFPDWFYKNEPTMPHAIAIILYELNVSLSSGQIAKIISKAWKDIDLRNVSKFLTTRGKWLYVFVEKDSDRRYRLNDKGREWVEKEVIPLYRASS